jgi:hypothetical protein
MPGIASVSVAIPVRGVDDEELAIYREARVPAA